MLDRKLLLISGKGGVGKSAVTASLALRASRLGKTVLAIGLVDGIGLAAHLGAEERSYEPHEVHPGIHTFTVDRARTLDEYLKIQLPVPRSAPTRQLSRALDVLVETAPGVREIVSMGKPIFEVWKASYDIVLVDAPPLGQLLSYLRAPLTISDLVSSGTIHHQAEEMRLTLADPEATGLLLVTTAEELPALETTEALEVLGAEGLCVLAGLVVNRVLPPLDVVGDLAALPDGPHRAAAMLHAGLHEDQDHWRSTLPDHDTLPFLFGVLTPGEVSARLADVWDES
ncbi:MAG: ArsA family ATPase [Acidimicrobiia bacterium]